MIVANMATYPPRLPTLPDVLGSICPQVDKLNLVLNECETAPQFLTDFPNVVPHLPDRDLKDVGKFLPDPAGAAWVFLVDDDILYPPDYATRTLDSMAAADATIGGYHANDYRPPRFRLTERSLRKLYRYHLKGDIMAGREVLHFKEALDAARPTDQLGSGTIALPAHLMPPFEVMDGSQKFVDVRFARYCFEEGIPLTVLPRPSGWMKPLNFEETIWTSFTADTPPHVRAEIEVFATKTRR